MTCTHNAGAALAAARAGGRRASFCNRGGKRESLSGRPARREGAREGGREGRVSSSRRVERGPVWKNEAWVREAASGRREGERERRRATGSCREEGREGGREGGRARMSWRRWCWSEGVA